MRLWPAALWGGLTLSPPSTTTTPPPVQYPSRSTPIYHSPRRSAWIAPLLFSSHKSPAHICSNRRPPPPSSRRPSSPSPSLAATRLLTTRRHAAQEPYYYADLEEQSKFPEWVQQWKPSDESGCPEKMAWLGKVLPGVNVQQLVEAVPHVLFWSEDQLLEKIKFLEENLEGYEINRVLADSPSLLGRVDHLREVFKMLKEMFPDKKVVELFPRGPFSEEHPMREWGREWQEPYSTLVRLPYADPGLMNYNMQEFEEVTMNSFPAWGSREEDRQEMVKFKKALERGIAAFELRVNFLREHYGEDQFQRYHADGLYEDVVGQIDEWINTHPGYESYLEDKLNGYDGKDLMYYRALTPIEKEDLYVAAYREGWGRDNIDEEEEEELDLDDDEIAAKKGLGGNAQVAGPELSEEEKEEMEEMERALKAQAWQFELRTGYMKEQMEEETFRRTLGRDVNGLALGDIQDFLKQFPGYDAWMATQLDGVDDEGMEVWAKRDPEEKEEVMVSLMDGYGVAMYKAMLEREKEANAREALFTPEGQEAVWGQESPNPPKKSRGGGKP